MSFRRRLYSLFVAIVLLSIFLVLGFLFSPERVQARTTDRPLLDPGQGQYFNGIEIRFRGEKIAILRRQVSGWVALADGRSYPASQGRISLLLRNIAGLTRGRLASGDPGHFSELGLGEDSARRLILHRSGSGPDLELLVGKRGPSGDEDYIRVGGEGAAYLVRGSLAFFLAQDRPYWYELHVLPEDVQGATIAMIAVSGRFPIAGPPPGFLEGPYTLSKATEGKSAQEPSHDSLTDSSTDSSHNPSRDSSRWSLGGGEGNANQIAAGAMANALAALEGEEFADPAVTEADRAREGTAKLAIEIGTAEGKKYSISARPGPEPGKAFVTTSSSPLTYIVDEAQLRRAVLALSRLRAAR